jgi:hypothetical protein
MNATYRLESEIVGVDDDGDNVVLATESRSSGNGLSIAIDEEGDAPLATDTPADKLEAVMQALTRCADDTAEATGEDRCAHRHRGGPSVRSAESRS